MSSGKGAVAVGLSGGADSAYAACLLRDQGVAVVGLTMQLWGESDEGTARALAAAREVARHLGIPHTVLDLRDAFRARIVDPFLAAYRAGLTPSPCVWCNRLMKFGLMLEAARSLGCERLATGHYARVGTGADGRATLRRGCDPRKDQSYFLAGLNQDQLRCAVFPLGCLRKGHVAAEARRLGLVPPGVTSSQDVCFIHDGDTTGFLRRAAGPDAARPGDIVDRGGRVLGRHSGALGYTIGQRQGLGLGGGPWYVLAVDPAANRVTVGRREECAARDVPVEGVNWLGPAPGPGSRVPVQAQVRYAMRAAAATLEVMDPVTEGVLRFAEPVHAVTPGQFAVMYQGDEVLAGGWIRAGRCIGEGSPA